MEANVEVEDFELAGSLAWKLLKSVNQKRKGAKQSNVAMVGAEQLLPCLAVAQPGEARGAQTE